MIQHDGHVLRFQLVELLIFTDLDVLFDFSVYFVTNLIKVVLLLASKSEVLVSTVCAWVSMLVG